MFGTFADSVLFGLCVGKALDKWFLVMGRGKIVRRCTGKQHLLAEKNTKRKKRLSKMVDFCSVHPKILNRRLRRLAAELPLQRLAGYS